MDAKGVLLSICDSRTDCSRPVSNPAKEVDEETRLHLHIFDPLATYPRIKFGKYFVQFWDAGLHSSGVTTLAVKGAAG